MAASVNGQAVRTTEKSLPGELAALPKKPARMGIDEKNDENAVGSGASRAVVREAIRESSLLQKSFSIDAKCSEGNVGDALSGARHLPWAWIFAQTDPSFRVHFVKSLSAAWDVNHDAEVNELEALAGRLVQMAMRVARRQS